MIIKPSTYFLLLLLFIHKSTSKLVKNYSNKLVHLDTISDETMSVNSGNEVPLFHSLLVHTNLIGKKIVDNNSNDDDAEYYVVSRSNDKVRQLWSTRTHTELRGAAPALQDRDSWDAQIDFNLMNYISLIETFLHTYLDSKNVVVENILGNTGLYYEKARALAAVFADPRVETVCEIGFNAGHSALNALAAREGVQVLSFDLGQFWDAYGKYSYELLQHTFPNQLTLVMGDSTVTVPKFIQEKPEQKCNIIFVDGGHDFDTALADISNMKAMANQTYHRLIVDDANWGEVRQAWDKAVDTGIVQETGWVHSNYCQQYNFNYVVDEKLGVSVPILSPGLNAIPGDANVDAGSLPEGTYPIMPTGAMSFGKYF